MNCLPGRQLERLEAGHTLQNANRKMQPPVMIANRASAVVPIGLTIAMVGVVGGEARNDATGAIYDVDMSAFLSPTLGVWPSLRTFSGTLYLVAFFAGAFGCWMRFIYRMPSTMPTPPHQHAPGILYLAAIGDGILILALALISIVSDTLPADMVFMVFVGVSYLQICIEATRADRTNAKSPAAKPSIKQSLVWVFRAALTLLPMCSLGMGRRDSLAEYFPFWTVISPYISLLKCLRAAPEEVAARGQFASLLNLTACCEAFWNTLHAFFTTGQVKGVPLAVTITIFIATVVIASISNFWHRARRIHIYTNIPDPDKQGQDQESMEEGVRTDPLTSPPTTDSAVSAH